MSEFSEGFWNRLKWYGGLFGIFAGKALYILINRIESQRGIFDILAAISAILLVIAFIDFSIQLLKVSKVAFLRLMGVLSLVWLIFASNKADMWSIYGRFQEHFGEFLTLGVLPLIVIWGIIWVTSGIKKK